MPAIVRRRPTFNTGRDLPCYNECIRATPGLVWKLASLPGCHAGTTASPVFDPPVCWRTHFYIEGEPTNEPGSIYYYASLIAIFSYLDDAHGEEKGKHRQSDQYSNLLPSSAREIARLVALQRSTWGVHMFPSFSMDWVTRALLALLNDINNPQSHEAFLDLFDTAVLAARRWEHAKRALGAVQLAAEQKGMILRAEV